MSMQCTYIAVSLAEPYTVTPPYYGLYIMCGKISSSSICV